MKLDYYIGRPLSRVIQNEDGEASEWGVELEGGVLIRNQDGRRTVAPDSETFMGTSLLKVEFDEQHTTLQLGHSNQQGSVVVGEIQLTPALYTLADAEYTGGTEVYPQAEQEPVDNLPPDPSAERVVDGPETPQEGTESQGAGQ